MRKGYDNSTCRSVTLLPADEPSLSLRNAAWCRVIARRDGEEGPRRAISQSSRQTHEPKLLVRRAGSPVALFYESAHSSDLPWCMATLAPMSQRDERRQVPARKCEFTVQGGSSRLDAAEGAPGGRHLSRAALLCRQLAFAA
jgi:hypothetical protein